MWSHLDAVLAALVAVLRLVAVVGLSGVEVAVAVPPAVQPVKVTFVGAIIEPNPDMVPVYRREGAGAVLQYALFLGREGFATRENSQRRDHSLVTGAGTCLIMP